MWNKHSMVNFSCWSNMIVSYWWLDGNICHGIVNEASCLTYIIAKDSTKVLIVTKSWFHAPSSMPHPLRYLWCIHHRTETSIIHVILNRMITLKHSRLNVCFGLIVQSTLFHRCQLSMRAENLTIHIWNPTFVIFLASRSTFVDTVLFRFLSSTQRDSIFHL